MPRTNNNCENALPVESTCNNMTTAPRIICKSQYYSLLHNRGRDFGLRPRKFGIVADGISTAYGIASLFASNYQRLHTSVFYDRSEMGSISRSVLLTSR